MRFRDNLIDELNAISPAKRALAFTLAALGGAGGLAGADALALLHPAGRLARLRPDRRRGRHVLLGVLAVALLAAAGLVTL